MIQSLIKALLAFLRLFKSETTTQPQKESKAPTESHRDDKEASRIIATMECRFDDKGCPKIYDLPSNDGGGKSEICGINEKYHPKALVMIKALPPHQRLDAVVDHIDEYTKAHCRFKTSNRGLDLSLRDCTFNRGGKGCVYIVQIALNSMLNTTLIVDGKYGTNTANAFTSASVSPAPLIDAIAKARYVYERDFIGLRINLVKGLVRRFEAVRVESHQLNEKTP